MTSKTFKFVRYGTYVLVVVVTLSAHADMFYNHHLSAITKIAAISIPVIMIANYAIEFYLKPRKKAQ
jgi:hypothetical protein